MIPALERFGGEELREAVRSGAMVCTATQRLARALLSAWDDLMREEGRAAWRAPRILPYATWLRNLVEAHLLFDDEAAARGRILLTNRQEQLTWELALEDQGDALSVLQPEMLATLLMEAHALEHAWCVGEEDLLRHEGMGSSMYLRTRRRVRERWAQDRHLPVSALPTIAIEAVKRSSTGLPDTVVFMGFDLLPDHSFTEMHRVLRGKGVRIIFRNVREVTVAGPLLRYASFEEEITAAAEWARDILLNGGDDVGIVVPALQRSRTAIERIFSDVLSPRTVLHGHDAETGLFELSLGPRCTDEPLIAAALTALDLLHPEVSVAALGRLLRSPFFHTESDARGGRFRCDLALREVGIGAFPRHSLISILEPFAAGDRLIQTIREQTFPTGMRSMREWSREIENYLRSLGWPGTRKLTSREYQAVRRWNELLEDLARCDAVLPPTGIADTIAHLRTIAAEQIFQPETRGAPVQIMGVLETAGMRFAHCRVMGMNEEQWPPPARNNPFLPLALQRSVRIPEAVPDRYLEQMQGVMARLAAASPDMVCTCARTEGDRELLPSPLLKECTTTDAVVLQSTNVSRMREAEDTAMERLIDMAGPELQVDEDIRGGVRVLTLQSACPFRAFATLRLHAAEPADVVSGVRPIDRGNLIHESLRRIWGDLRDSAGLAMLGEEELRERLERHILEAEHSLRDVRSSRLPEHVRDAERRCVREILLEWFGLERERTAFTVVATEGGRELQLGALRLHLRIDRTDRLSDDRLLLIDYKSSRHTPLEWMQERPREPQLPMYAIAQGEQVGALAYGILRRGECAFQGLADDDREPNVAQPLHEWLQRQDQEEMSWMDMIALWERRLRSLADAFSSGKAEVDPRDGSDTCDTCTLQILCRIDELRRMEADD
ncbi:MAG: PD-(D/E)XK nuclease family protein [Bacteroidetes bacterium]|nr:PD-(D/E)XK nuclease family protein [Bacteroidota bacterium]